MQEHLVAKHPYGKLRIFRGADGSAVIREKGAYGNHMVEVGNLTQEVEMHNMAGSDAEDTATNAAVNALNAAANFGLTTSSAADQLNQAAQLATGLSLWNIAMPGVTSVMNNVGGLVPGPTAVSLAQQFGGGSPSSITNNVINIAPAEGNDENDTGNRRPLKSKHLAKIKVSDDDGDNTSNGGSNGNGNDNTTDSDAATDDTPLFQVNGNASSPANGTGDVKTNRRFNRRKAAAPSHIRQRQAPYPEQDSAENQDASELVDKLVDEGALYRCDACNILFPEYSVYVLHLGCHGSGDTYECHFCKVIFDDKFGFLTHFTQCVRGDAQGTEGDE